MGDTTIIADGISGLRRQLAEVDENLCGTRLTSAERSLFTARRKEIYEAMHPETRNGGDRKSEKARSDQNDKLSFCSDTAAKTGVTAKTVEREAARGAALAEDLPAIIGTSLDSGVEQDALAAGLVLRSRRSLLAYRSQRLHFC